MHPPIHTQPRSFSPYPLSQDQSLSPGKHEEITGKHLREIRNSGMLQNSSHFGGGDEGPGCLGFASWLIACPLCRTFCVCDDGGGDNRGSTRTEQALCPAGEKQWCTLAGILIAPILRCWLDHGPKGWCQCWPRCDYTAVFHLFVSSHTPPCARHCTGTWETSVNATGRDSCPQGADTSGRETAQ